MSKRLIILGATGSIGAAAAEVAREHPGEFSVAAVAALNSRGPCEALAREFGAKPYTGPDAALRAVEENDADVCLVATVGTSGLRPTLAAIEKGMDVALATKEVLVMAGALVTSRAAERGVRFLPVDSEHSAIFQCLPERDGRADASELSKIVLTASGGPFLDAPADLSSVTPEQALRHPRWNMGRKVTVDSATMMNKGFEAIEAMWLFGLPEDRIGIVVHPESVVHSLATFRDGATLAQLSPPDMKVAIQYALTWPRRLPARRAALDLASLGALTFRAPDESRFPALSVVREACRAGGAAPAAVAAADEWAVEKFLSGAIRFTDIVRAASRSLEAFASAPCGSADEIEELRARVFSSLDSWKPGASN